MGDITIGFVLDKSGSMQAMWDDAIGAFNAFRAAQALEPTRTALSLTLFDSEVRLEHGGLPIEEVADLAPGAYVPSGPTALYDAVGFTIEDLQRRPGLPPRVLVAVLTDGQENASRVYTRNSLRALIETKKAIGWDFLYLGTGIENWADARALGADYLAFCPNSDGIAAAFCTVSTVVRDLRTLGPHGAVNPSPRVK